jgi:ribosomal-protein-alanine N-acetyltransferase
MKKTYTTERLILKPIDESDQAFIFSQFSNDIVNAYLFDAEPLTNPSEALDIITFYSQGNPTHQERFILKLKTTHEPLGTIGYHAYNKEASSIDIGYDLNPAYFSQGYMREALSFLIDYIKENLSVLNIHACIYPKNQKSIDLVKHFGFTYNKNSYEHFRGEEILHHVYRLTIK